MDFGATQCTPQSPRCAECPLMETCSAFREQRVNELPVKLKTLKVKERHFTYIYIRYQDETAIRRRPAGDIWQGLYEPLNFEIGNLKFEVDDYLCALMSNTESKQLEVCDYLCSLMSNTESKQLEVDDYLCALMSNTESKQLRSHCSNHKCQTSNFKLQILASQVKHVLTHRIIMADFYLWQPDERPTLPDGYFWIKEQDIDRYAVPRLVEILLETLSHSPSLPLGEVGGGSHQSPKHETNL